MKNNFKTTAVLMIIAFIITANIGSLGIEGARIATGKKLGYEGAFFKGIGIFLFAK